MPSFGTRLYSRARQLHPPGGSLNSITTRDKPGAAKLLLNVTAVFAQPPGGGNEIHIDGTDVFASFSAGDTIEVIGSVLNSGVFTILYITAPGVGRSAVGVDPNPKPEGPVMVTIRTP